MAHEYLSAEIGNLRYAYSFKKLVSGYAGNCVRVRRDSDNSTQDIGFSGDELDSSSLTTFLGAANGFIDTWYDQTGTVNLVQATQGDQPRIIQEDGVWTVRFDGSSASMQLENASALTTATNSALHCIWKAPQAYPSQISTSWAGFQFGSSDQQFNPWGDSGNGPRLLTKSGSPIQTRGTWEDGNWRQHIVTFNNGTATPYEFASKIFDGTALTNPDMAHFYVGGNGTTAASMYLTEVVWFDDVIQPSDLWLVSKNNYSALFSYDDIFLHVGDSITSGTRAGTGGEWTYQLHNSLGTLDWFTRAQSGFSLANWNNFIDDLLFFGKSKQIPATGARVAIVFAGTNDLAGAASAAETFTRLKTLVQSLRQGRFGLIGVITALPGDPSDRGAGFEAKRTTFNQSIRDDSSGDWDFIIDTDSNSNLTDFSNTTYFTVDGVHLNSTGAAEIASMVETALSGFNLDNYILPEVPMAITFAVRGDSLDARYSGSGKTPAILNTTDPAEVNTDEAGINGSNSIDLAGAFASSRGLLYNGNLSTPSDRPRSILTRAKFNSTTNIGLFQMGAVTRGQYNYIGAYISSGGEVTVVVGNANGQTSTHTTSGAGIGTTAWHDIVVTWDGTTGANSLEVFVDGVSRGTFTPTRSLPSPFSENDRRVTHQINIGQQWNIVTCHHFVDEFVVFDEVIDPTDVTLTSGNGSLNGASRAAYVDVASFDGAAAGGGRQKGIGNFGN